MGTSGCAETPEKHNNFFLEENETFKFGINADCKYIEH